MLTLVIALAVVLAIIVAGQAVALSTAGSNIRRLKGEATVNSRTIAQLETHKTPKPVCVCDHGINFHDQATGKCIQTVSWQVRGGLAKFVEVLDREEKCKCLRYVGPEPLPEIYHPLEIGI